MAHLVGRPGGRKSHRQGHLFARRGAIPGWHGGVCGLSTGPRFPRQAPAGAHLYVRLHQRWLRALAGFRGAGGPAARGRGPGGQPLVNPQINIDLHTHSTHSDGSLTPAELVALAAAAGVQVMALTDHDTITGLEDAQRSTDALGLRLVPGVEISASWRSQAVHVLGLWIDPCSPPLRAMLDSQAERRVLRMHKMCARLSKLGLPGDALLVAVEARPGVPTRAHLAGALLAGGHVASAEGAFRKYLGAGKPAHVSEDWPAVETVVARILGAGGVAALAHPLRYRLSAGARRRPLAGLAARGG